MKDILLAENGRTDWRIVMDHPAHETIKYAADELQRFLLEMSGASLPVQTVLAADGEYEILIGRGKHLNRHEISFDWDSLGEEGYVIRTGEHFLLLAGATPRGTLYAVYDLLYRLGCRFFSSDCSVIPRRDRLTFPETDRMEKPAFESREAYWRDAFDGSFAVRNRMNSNKADISVRQGGRMKFYNFHHSFADLISSDVYFDAHPEYFSMVDGKRLKEHTQLCLTNPEVVELVVRGVKKWIRENPDCRVFSVAQNDWLNYCTCPACAKADAEEGSHSGTMIRFVNEVADRVAAEYPDVLIHTFAYQYTRKAPRLARPRPNVIVRLCSIECCFVHPLDGSLVQPLTNLPPQGHHPQCAALGETAFLDDLREWSRITPRLYVWDYVTQFRNYLIPMPNFDVLDKNLRLFRDIGVKGVLEQGNFSHGGGGHLAELEAYLQARLLWDPDEDMEELMMDFLKGYYGPQAAQPIREYIELWQQSARQCHVGIGADSRSDFINDDTIRQAVELLSRALFLTRESPYRDRLEKLALGMRYLILARMPADTPGRDALISEFAWQLRRHGITEIHERWTLEESIQELRRHGYEREQTRSVVNDYKM